MSFVKPIVKYSDDDIVKIVTADFTASTEDRADKNWQNYLQEKTFLGIDLLQPLVPQKGDNNLGLGLSERENEDPDRPVRSSIYLPYARSLVLTAKTLICGGIFPNNTDFFSVESQHADEQAAAEAFRAYAHYDMRRARYQDEAELAIERSLVFDFQLLMVDWETCYDWVPEFLDVYRQITDPETGEMLDVGEPIGKRAKYVWKKAARSGIFFHSPSTFNVRHDPNAIHGQISPRTCDWVGLEYQISWKRLRAMAESGELNKAKVAKAQKESPNPPNTTAIDFDAMLREDIRLAAERKGKEFKAGAEKSEDEELPQMALVQDYWDHGSRVTVVNGKYVVRKQYHVGIPFVKLVTHPVHGQFGGVPLIQGLMHIQIDINTMTRLRRDAQNQAVNKTMILDGNAFRSDDEIQRIRLNSLEKIVAYPQPGRAVTDAVSWVQPPDPSFATFQEQQSEMQFAERLSSIGDATQGLLAGSRRTATEHELVAAGSARRSGFDARTLERPVIAEVVQKMLVLYNLHLRSDQKYRVLGPSGTQWRTISPSDMFFTAPPDIIPTGLAGEQSRALETDLFLRAVDQIKTVQPWGSLVDWPKLLNELLVKLRVANPQRFVRSDVMQGVDVEPSHENILMAGAVYVKPLMAQDHTAHIAAHAEFAESPEFQRVPKETQKLFLQHVQEHAAMLQQASTPAAPAMPAAGMPPGPMPTPTSQAELMSQAGRRMQPPAETPAVPAGAF